MTKELVENHDEYPKKYAFVGQAHEAVIEYFLKSDFSKTDIYPEDLNYYRYER